MEGMSTNTELQKVEIHLAVLKDKEKIMLAMQEAGIPDVEINDESEVFGAAQAAVAKLTSYGLDKNAAVSLAAVQASMQVVEKTGSTVEELIDTISPQLPEVVRILSKNVLVVNEEVSAGITKRIVFLMKESGGQMPFVEALMSAISERLDVVAKLSSVSGYIDDEGVASFDNPRKGDDSPTLH